MPIGPRVPPVPLNLTDHIDALEREGALFAAAVRRAAPDAIVPTCPGWTIRDLVLHQCEVHRWAVAAIEQGAAGPRKSGEPAGSPPSDDGLADWLLDGHRTLVRTLRDADPDVGYFTFLADPAPPLQFWARRQAHETGIHRVDAESATGQVTLFSPALAADGIDEMLTGFVPRSRTPLHNDAPTSLLVQLSEADFAWRVAISSEPAVTERISARADQPAAACVVTGPAADIYPALWNRRDLGGLDIAGDVSVLDMFRDSVKIRWS